MKTCLRLILVSMALFAFSQVSEAQQPYGGGGYGPTYGSAGAYESGAFQPMAGDVNLGMPGRMWFGANYADSGLGYTGSYLTLGMKTRLGDDALDGRWLFQGEGHYAIESGGFFGNFGLERVFTVSRAGADVSLGAWFDYDGDEQGLFAHTFQQVGLSGAIKTRFWDITANGYFPIGTANHQQIGADGQECFFESFIALQPGLDSALKGFDATLRMRPPVLGMFNGSIDIGGYGYGSDLIEYFGGGRVRLGMQILQGMIVTAEVNHDDRFDTTGVLSASWMFGVNARGNEYAGLGRDLENTIRNHHIVRVQRDVVLAINPDTGLPYNVLHVDNTADAAFADGTAATPFSRLSDAETASSANDMIFVHVGDGTTRRMNQGITLQDGQYLLGEGVEHIIPIQNGLNFTLCNQVFTDGTKPVISNVFGAGVTLADNNTIRGLTIDGSDGGMSFGIFGDGDTLDGPVNGGTIEDTMINNAILDGVFVNNLIGDWNVNRNTITANGRDGIFFQNACDPTSIFLFEDNIVNGNGRDGIHFLNYDAQQITFLRNITNNNLRNGVNLENFKNTLGTGIDLTFPGHVSTGNLGDGFRIAGGDGNLTFLNSDFSNNLGHGLNIVDWTNTDPRSQTLIAATTGGVSQFLNNGGAGINIQLNDGTQRVFVTQSTMDGNDIGIRSGADGLSTFLTTQVVDNLSISTNRRDGLRFVTSGGALHSVLVEQTQTLFPAILPITGNGTLGGSGINFVGSGLPSTSQIEAVVRNVAIAGTGGNGVTANFSGDSALNLLFEDSTVTGSAGSGFVGVFNNNGNLAINRIQLQNLQVTNSGVNGIVLATSGGTFTDMFVRSVNVDTGGGTGFAVNAAGTAGGVIDNRTRVALIGSTVTNFLGDGVNMTTAGDAHLLTEIRSNAITANGAGPAGDSTLLPFGDGLSINSNGTSLIAARVTNNTITGNSDIGYSQIANGASTMNVLFEGNALTGNDFGEDPNNDPIIDANGINFLAVNAATAETCMALSDNLMPGFIFANGGAPGDFRVELDGLTNGFGQGAVGGNFQFGAFGSVCEPAIEAEEAAFAADGFPSN